MFPDPGLLALTMLAGMLITLSPCILPVLPVMASAGLARSRWAPLMTGAGLAVGFALMGVALHGVGLALGLMESDTRPVFSALLLVAGVLLLVPALGGRMGGAFAPLSSAADRLASRVEGLPGGSFLLGLLLGAVWSPCAGPLLGAAIGLAGAGGLGAAGVQMLAFGLGSAIPLIAVAYWVKGSARRWLPVIAEKGQLGRRALGASLAVVGAFVLTGADKALLAWAVEIMPMAWVDLVTAI